MLFGIAGDRRGDISVIKFSQLGVDQFRYFATCNLHGAVSWAFGDVRCTFKRFPPKLSTELKLFTEPKFPVSSDLLGEYPKIGFKCILVTIVTNGYKSSEFW